MCGERLELLRRSRSLGYVFPAALNVSNENCTTTEK